MNKSKKKGGQTDQLPENKNGESQMISVSKQPKIMPEEKPLKESDKHLTPPPINAVPEIPAHASWGPANRKKR